jgi:putative restriction endonuclease
MTILDLYAKKFAKLRVDRSRGVAPHKPILLLSVINFFERNTIKDNRIFLTAELISTFKRFWHQLGTERHNSDIALPFYHLTGEGFWHLQGKPGYESVIDSKVKLRNVRALRQFVFYAYLDEELFQLLLDPMSRDSLVNVIVEKWFPYKKKEIEQLLKIDSFTEFTNRLKEKGGAVYKVEDLEDEEESIVRDAAFRKNVVSVYDYRCAFCRLKIISSLSQNIVDGAHIKPFSQFYDDRIDNGMSLCKNHHWAFDRGWFAVNEDYKIKVSQTIKEESPHTKPMQDFDGEELYLPSHESYFPRIEAIQWHYQNTFIQ